MSDQEINREGQVYTLDEAFESVGFGKFQVLVFLYAGLGCIAEAMEVMILSFVGPAVNTQWGISSSQESLLTTVVFAGMLIGAYSWGIIADNYGRRIGLLSVAIVTTIPAFLSAFAPNYYSLLALRMIVGIGLGGGPVYNSWFLEFVPTQNRGRWMVVFSTTWTVGTILEASLAWIIMPRWGWRWLLAISSLPAFAALVFYGLTVESPRYLYMKGRINDADQILHKMAAVNRTKLPGGVLVSDQVAEPDKEEYNHSENTQLLSPEREKTVVSYTGFTSLSMLFSSRLIKTTLLMWVIYFGNSFAYYGIILLTSELSSKGSECGSIVLHSKSSDDSSLYRDVFITSFAELPGIIFSAFIVDTIGRKYSLALMYMLGIVIMLPLMFHQHEILTTGLLFGARMCMIGTFTVAGIYCPEIYPTSIRTTGVGVASAVGRIGGMICPAVAVGLVTDCHQTSAIILFEIVIFFSAISVLFIPHETKGRQLTDNLVVSN